MPIQPLDSFTPYVDKTRRILTNTKNHLGEFYSFHKDTFVHAGYLSSGFAFGYLFAYLLAEVFKVPWGGVYYIFLPFAGLATGEKEYLETKGIKVEVDTGLPPPPL